MSGLSHVPEDVLRRHVAFAARHSRAIPRHQLLQKLVIFDFVAPIVAAHPHESILEIGSGLGIHSALLSRYGSVASTELAAPGSFIGADRDVAGLRNAVISELAERPVSFSYNDGSRLPYDDRSFDLVFHNSVIEHVPDATVFNREVYRVLKPGGTSICITGTPVLCWFRLVKDYILKLPVMAAIAAAREIPLLRGMAIGILGRAGVSGPRVAKFQERLQPVHERLVAILGRPARGPAEPRGDAVDIRSLYAPLFHYLYFPAYNRIVVDEIAREAAIPTEELLARVYDHFLSLTNRIRFALTPTTHGQHYRGIRHEMREWSLERWTERFLAAGFAVEDIVGYRYHHLLEWTPSYAWDAALYYWAAENIHEAIAHRRFSPKAASEIILVATKVA